MRTRCTYLIGISLLVLLILTNKSSFSQSKEYSLTFSKENLTLQQLFKEIQDQTGLSPSLNSKAVDQSEKIKLGKRKTSLSEVREKLSAMGYDTRISEHSLILVKKPTDDASTNDNRQSTNQYPLKTQAPIDTTHDRFSITGFILDQTGAPLPGASVFIAGTNRGTIARADGSYTISDVSKNSILTVSQVGYKNEHRTIFNQGTQDFNLEVAITGLNEVSVVSTGYQDIPKERTPGSFTTIGNKLLNRSSSTDIIGRISDISSSVQYDPINSGNPLGINVRGRSTIFANTTPLIVLDNFPYDGDISNINPNDIENITILKDAAAASIWGVRAANGVIVIKTKKGISNDPLKVSFSSNITISQKPNLNTGANVNSSEYIDLETLLFNKGFYDNQFSDYNQPSISPVVSLLNDVRNGKISNQIATDSITKLRSQDIRKDLSQYYYRPTFNQQYSLAVSGGGNQNRYYISGGYDNNLSNYVRNNYQRATIDASNTIWTKDKKLEITTNILYTQSRTANNSSFPTFGTGIIYPYAKLAGPDGTPLSIDMHNANYIDTAGAGKLMNWTYQPLNDLKNNDNTTTLKDYRIEVGAKYKITNWLSTDEKYLYGNGTTNYRTLYDTSLYFTRDLINSYTSIDWDANTVTRPIPIGAIIDLATSQYISQYFRHTFDINLAPTPSLSINGILGAEIRDVETQLNRYRQYGYDPDHMTSMPVDFANQYANYITGSTSQIPNPITNNKFSDKNTSLFGNAAISYLNKYFISGSFRKDGSNLFGVNANQKWAPLWSVGAKWDIYKENNFHSRIVNKLSARVTYGFNGNIDKSVSALLVTQQLNANIFNEIQAFIINPPNPNLKWERTGQLNLGLDFSILNDRLYGSIEYYKKKGKDLMGYAPLAPSSGFPTYKGNNSAITGNGVDIVLNSLNTKGLITWSTSLNFSYNTDKVTTYNIDKTSNSTTVTGSTPIVGKPISSMYSYKWAGLSPTTGDPQGYLDGHASSDYGNIFSSNGTDNIEYNGRLLAPVFGNIINTVAYKNISFSFNITYKFGSYFRRPSIDYSKTFSGNTLPHKDIENRWQNPGDEKTTNVPSLVYPPDANRDNFYTYSSILATSASRIRLNDIQLAYQLTTKQKQKQHQLQGRIFVTLTNIGLLWKANKFGIDPDYIATPGYQFNTPPMTLTTGINLNF